MNQNMIERLLLYSCLYYKSGLLHCLINKQTLLLFNSDWNDCCSFDPSDFFCLQHILATSNKNEFQKLLVMLFIFLDWRWPFDIWVDLTDVWCKSRHFKDTNRNLNFDSTLRYLIHFVWLKKMNSFLLQIDLLLEKITDILLLVIEMLMQVKLWIFVF
jgi:hypothetical protein